MFQQYMGFPDPLIAFHQMLRASAPAGYPNSSYYSPHLYEMQRAHGFQGVRPSPFRYHFGRRQAVYGKGNRMLATPMYLRPPYGNQNAATVGRNAPGMYPPAANYSNMYRR